MDKATFARRAVLRIADKTCEFIVTDDDLKSLERAHPGNSDGLAVLGLLWVSLLADSPVDIARKPERSYRRFLGSFIRDPIGLIKHYASLYDRLTRSVTRAKDGITIDEFIGEFRDTPIFFEYNRFYKTHDPRIFKFISSFLLLGKKYYYEDVSFDEVAFRGWSQVEERLEGLTFEQRYLQDLREIVAWILRYVDYNVFLPKHGGGAVAERGTRDLTKKNDLLTSKGKEFTPEGMNPLLLARATTLTGVSDMAKDRISRLKFVPKDIGKSRSICMEPVLYQWLQQGVRLWVEDAMRVSLGSYIPLKDQSVNRGRARVGSVDGSVDTIDLSSASDSVHWDLVRSIMPRDLLELLSLTRTTSTLTPDGTVVGLQKFAPMGSALCFPIQCLIYAAVVIHGSLSWHFGQSAGEFLNLDRSTMDRYFHETYGRGKLARFSIFGDDIICDSKITSRVVETLVDLGFSVNSEKSFTGSSAFRESCGGYYLNGFDVTPIRAKLGPLDSTIPIKTLAAVISLANRSYDYGYLNLRRQLIRIALYYPIKGVKGRRYGNEQRNSILFTDDPDESFALYSPNPANKHLKKRVYEPGKRSRGTCFRYQRDEYLSLSIVPADPVKRREVDDWYWHTVWWRSRVSGGDDVVTSPNEIPRLARPGWRWTSCPGE